MPINKQVIIERMEIKSAQEPAATHFEQAQLLEILVGLVFALGVCGALLLLNSLIPSGW